jgi:aminopeptidase N
MIHTFVGEAGFQKGMKLYVERHDAQAVTIDDFISSMSDANGFDFTHLFLIHYLHHQAMQMTVERNA